MAGDKTPEVSSRAPASARADAAEAQNERGTDEKRRRRSASTPRPEPAKRARAEAVDANDKRSRRRALPISRPTVDECRVVYDALAQLFPEKAGAPTGEGGGGACGQRREVLDSLVGTMLSQNTTDTTSARAFAQLKRAFPEWEQVRTADPAAVEAQIKLCGLAATRTERIQAILQTLHQERGECSLEYLRPTQSVGGQTTAAGQVGV